MKPTIVQLIFAAVLLGGLAFRKPLLKPLLGSAWPLDEAGWHKLTLRFALFFLAMAALNEAVWRTQSTDFWVTFKVFGRWEERRVGEESAGTCRYRWSHEH